MSAAAEAMHRLPTVRTQILWAVNVSLASAFGILLVFAYQHELAEQLTEEHGSLESDATIHDAAIARFRDHGPEYVQSYLDTIGNRPLASYARKHKHSIVVCVQGGAMFVPQGHPAAQSVIAAMEAGSRSPDHRARFGDDELIVGSYTSGDQTVYVADHLSNLRSLVIRDTMWRVLGIVLLAVFGAAVLNLLLLRLIAHPLDHLVATVQLIGQGHLGLQAGQLKSAELNHLAKAISSMSQSLEVVDLQRRREMSKARQIQTHLVPEHVAVPGLQIAHLFLPAAEVAGDYYDVLPLPTGGWLLCIADVTGHGVPAAMTAAMLKALLLQAVEHHSSPDEILKFVNLRFCDLALPGDFASIFLARWQAENACMDYASAGHESGWLTSPSGVHELRSTGPLLGLMTEASWESRPVPAVPGERLILVTDGLTEAPVPGKGLFGRAHLGECLAECRPLPFDAVIPRLKEDLHQHLGSHPLSDDLTVMLVEFSMAN